MLLSHLPFDALPIYDEVQYIHVSTRWRDVLTEADLALYEKHAHSTLSPGLFNWLRNGRRVAGDPVSMPD
jgi:hypothetical protein